MKESNTERDEGSERVEVKSSCGRLFTLTVKLMKNIKKKLHGFMVHKYILYKIQIHINVMLSTQTMETSEVTQLYSQSIKNRI